VNQNKDDKVKFFLSRNAHGMALMSIFICLS